MVAPLNLLEKGFDILEAYLLKIYQTYFVNTKDIEQYLKVISLDVTNLFSEKEINFLKKCSDENIDLIALEYLLRKKQKKNIFSFVFLRLSSLAECIPQNQAKYVNKSKANIFKIFKILSMAVITTILLEVKRFILAKRLKEYYRCMM